MSWQLHETPSTVCGTAHLRRMSGLMPLLAAVCLAGCGISIPGSSEAETSDSTTSADPNLGMTTTDPAMMPGMHGATPMATPGMPAGDPAAMPGMTTADPAATTPPMHAPAMGHTAATPMTADPALATPPATAGHAAIPMPGADPAAVAATTPMPGANPGAVPMPGADPAAMAALAQPGAPGADAAAQGAQSSNRADQYEAGTPDRVVMEFADAIETGDIEAAGKLISDRARGTLATVRDGTISENQLAQLKAYTETLDRVGGRNLGSGVQISYNGGSGKVLQFKVSKGSTGFEITEMDIRDKPKRAGR